MARKRINDAGFSGTPRGRILDLTGQRFGKLTVLEFFGMRARATYWLCQCDCGQTTRVATGNLRRNVVQGCGCGVGKRPTRVPRSAEYYVWRRKVRQDSIFAGFEDFLDYVGNRPTDLHQLRRPDPSRPYGPGNCEWSKVRGMRGRTLEFEGQRKTLAQWAQHLGISIQALHLRLAKHDVVTALSQPRRTWPSRSRRDK